MSEVEREGNNMDKNTARQCSMPSKGNEHRKDNGSVTQKFPRTNRRKDVGTRNYDQAGPNRRPPTQKIRFNDKRPQSRCFSHGNNSDEMTNVEWTGPEHGSVQAWGSKKSNLSHLLNFHFEPRDNYGRGREVGYRGSYNRSRGKGYRGHGTTYNKEHFLQANGQFIVKETGDYSVHAADPDTLVDWDLIEQVRVYSHCVPSCPICLDRPKAAKITRCGHIYCAGCILHYLSLGDKQWRRCPICYDAVHKTNLKSVVSRKKYAYCSGDEITFKLMKRKRGSTVALPIDQWSDNEGHLYNMEGDVDSRYVKLLAATPTQAQHLMYEERQALQAQLQAEDTDSLEASYIQAAMDMLKEREENASLGCDVADELVGQIDQLKLEPGEETIIKATPVCFNSPDKKSVVYSSAFSDEEEDAPSSPTEMSTSIPKSGNLTPEACSPETDPGGADSSIVAAIAAEAVSLECESDALVTDESMLVETDESLTGEDGAVSQERRSMAGADYYYFFQADDGQHIYPHAINARCLIKEYGSLENCPRTISARIVEIEDITMHEDLRHRMRYLSHLPLTCEFQIAELALKPPLVSRETIQLFSRELERKRKQRQRKNREERKMSRRIQAEEDKDIGFDRSALIVQSGAPEHSIPESRYVQSACVATVATDSAHSTPGGSPPASSSAELLATSPASVASSDDGIQNTSLSFAQMLRAGKAKPQDAWPKPVGTQTPAPDKPKAKDSDENSENEDHVPVPVYRASFGDAIQKALDKYKTPGENTEAPVSVPNSGKKKKKQKTLLFTTTMNRQK